MSTNLGNYISYLEGINARGTSVYSGKNNATNTNQAFSDRPRMFSGRYNRYRRRNYRGCPYIRKNMRTMAMVRSVELKTYDATISETTTTSGSMTMLSDIAQGDDINAREGNEIMAKRLYCNYSFTVNGSATGVTTVRMIVFIDKEQQGTAPGLSDAAAPYGVLKHTASTLALMEAKTRKRFKILADRKWLLGTSTGEDDVASRHEGKIHFKIPRNGLKINYIGTSSAQASQGKGNLYCLLISNQATYGPSSSVNFRLRYYD